MRDRNGDLDYLLRATPAAACDSVHLWWPRQVALNRRHPRTIDCAIAGGFAADRVAWAFCAGYQAALRALVPQLPADALASLCVSEAGGNHPNAIRTTLRPQPGPEGGYLLDGAKRWTTLGPESALLLVAARVGDAAAGGRVPLRLVRVRQGAPGVSLRAMREISFVPEVAHAEVRFERVAVAADDLLEGDGYARYVKPFRTIEDLHVHAAILAYLLREARRLGWPRQWLERALAALHALRALAREDANAPPMHIALAGALETGAALVRDAEPCWDAVPDDAAALRWKRDRGLLAVAASARAKRTQRAWERIGAIPAAHDNQS